MYSRNYAKKPCCNQNVYYQSQNSDDRLFFPGGFVVPFVLGGIAGSALSRPNYGYYQPTPWFQPYPAYYNNYFYQDNPF